MKNIEYRACEYKLRLSSSSNFVARQNTVYKTDRSVGSLTLREVRTTKMAMTKQEFLKEFLSPGGCIQCIVMQNYSGNSGTRFFS